MLDKRLVERWHTYNNNARYNALTKKNDKKRQVTMLAISEKFFDNSGLYV